MHVYAWGWCGVAGNAVAGNEKMFEGAEGTKACEALCKALAAKSSSLLTLDLGGALYCGCTCDSMRVGMCVCLPVVSPGRLPVACVG